MNIEERVKWVSRDVKRFLAAKPDFDASLEYQCDADPYVKCHPNWVSSESDLTDEGLALRKYLQANPHLIDEA